MYLITRGITGFPNNIQDIEENVWYNIWQRKYWPYLILQHNDIVILKSVTDNHIRYFKGIVDNLLKINFKKRHQMENALNGFGYKPFKGDAYMNTRLDIQDAFLLAYTFKIVTEITPNANFNAPVVPQLGWIDINENLEAKTFFNLN